MYRVSKEFSDTIMGDNRRFTVKVTCLGEEVPLSISKIVYSGGCNGSDTPTIGNTVSAYVEITAESTDIILENKELCLYIGLKLNEKVEYIPIGCFIVKTIENDNGKMTLTAYDRMIKMEGLYVTSLKNYSITSILSEISSQKEININIPESDIVLDKKPQGYTYREMIGYIASLLGKNALIDRNGQLVFKWYHDTEYIVSADRIFNIKKSDKAYKIQKTECSTDAETVLRSGESSTRGISFSNPFMTQDILDNIYKEIKGMEFVPLSVSFLGDVTIDAGDVIKIHNRKDLYIVPIMNIEWEYDGGLISVVECVGNTDVEEEIDFKGPITKKVDNIFAELLKVDTFMAKAVTTETLAASVAQIDKLTSDDAIIRNIRATALTADTIKAAVADVGYITADKADLQYANITLANVEKESVGILLADVGLITSANIVDGHITGCLDSVEINADFITTGTLIADRLLLKGSKSGLLYQLNNLGELTSTSINTLDGDILTKRTVTADKLVAKSITTNELNVNEIFANSIVSNKLFAQDITATGTITGATIYGSDIIGGYFETDGNYLGIKSSLVLTGGMMMSFIGENDDAGLVGSFKTDNFLNKGKAIKGISLSCSSGKVVMLGRYNLTTTGNVSSMGLTASYLADPDMVLGYGVTNVFSGGIKLIEGAFSAPIIYENDIPLSSKFAASEHTHNYLSLTGGSLSGGITVAGTIKTSGANRVYGGDKIVMWTDNEGGNLEIISADGKYGYQFDAAGNNGLRLYCFETSPW
ncbi:MAG: hypothetical protein K2I03_08385, partial [Lachnospiraceae bacterium]|nr:hypothetical protein [Lachnospiraceae bacterium]